MPTPSGLVAAASVASALLLGISCHVDRAPMDAAHVERVLAIDVELQAELDESDRRWDQLKTLILERRQYLVEVDASGVPTQRVARRFDSAWEACSAIASDTELDLRRSDCEAEVNRRFIEAIGQRYFMADFDSLLQAQREQPELDLEVFVANSHNRVLGGELTALLIAVETRKAEFRALIDKHREQRIQLSARKRDDEIEEAEQKQRAAAAGALRAISAGMQTYAAGVSQTTHQTTTTIPSSSVGCSSDFSCGVGRTCVKQLYQSTGVCMRAANEYGAPSYTAPKLDSVGPNVPKASSCTSAGATCPVGFRCDYGSGRCIR